MPQACHIARVQQLRNATSRCRRVLPRSAVCPDVDPSIATRSGDTRGSDQPGRGSHRRIVAAVSLLGTGPVGLRSALRFFAFYLAYGILRRRFSASSRTNDPIWSGSAPKSKWCSQSSRLTSTSMRGRASPALRAALTREAPRTIRAHRPRRLAQQSPTTGVRARRSSQAACVSRSGRRSRPRQSDRPTWAS
jgi:hypothetical protein